MLVLMKTAAMNIHVQAVQTCFRSPCYNPKTRTDHATIWRTYYTAISDGLPISHCAEYEDSSFPGQQLTPVISTSFHQSQLARCSGISPGFSYISLVTNDAEHLSSVLVICVFLWGKTSAGLRVWHNNSELSLSTTGEGIKISPFEKRVNLPKQ